jgi:hypothetical protein
MTTLDDRTLINPDLLRRFELEGQFEGADGRYYALIRRQDGNLLAHHPTGPQVDPQQMLWGGRVLGLLNRELHHDGAWVLVFTHPKPPEWSRPIDDPKHWLYDRYCLLWIDEDGDVQFTVEWSKGDGELYDFTDVIFAGIESTVAKCDGAWQTWHTMMRQVPEIKQGDARTFKRAKGERAPSARQ